MTAGVMKAKSSGHTSQPSEPIPFPNPGIGRHLRMARLARGLRLKEVAAAAGCSEGLMSKIENDKADPSLKLLHRVCAALDMKVGDLLSWAEKRDAIVVRAADRVAHHFRHEGGPGTVIERLSLSGQLINGYLHHIAPGGSTGDPITHPGEELGFVVKGELELVIGDETYSVATGDSFCFHSDTPHAYRNRSKAEAQLIIVNSPPSF